MISRRSLLAAGVLTPLVRRAAAADSRYPNRTVTVISPFAAGGQSDSVGRVMNNHFQRVFGQPFVMENRAGAGGNIAGEAANATLVANLHARLVALRST